MLIKKLSCQLFFTLALLSCVVLTAQATGPKAIDKPALKALKAPSSTMLDVTQVGDRLVAAGERGIILLSDDGGDSWQQANVPTSVNITTLKFIDQNTGWAVGHMGLVLKTEDGGLNWRKQLDGLQAANIAMETVKNSGNKRQIKQAKYLVEDGPDKPFFDILIDAKGYGFIIGAFNLIFRTEDAGQSWQYWSPKVENPYTAHLYAIEKTASGYIIVGEQGLILQSKDKGETFSNVESPYEGSWFGVHRDPSGTLLIYGLRGNVYHSDDEGQNWYASRVPAPVSISAATAFADGKILIANQAGDLLVSQDQGVSFKPLNSLKGMPIASLVYTLAGDVVTAGLRGIKKIKIK